MLKKNSYARLVKNILIFMRYEDLKNDFITGDFKEVFYIYIQISY
jgi:hypothetical protein